MEFLRGLFFAGPYVLWQQIGLLLEFGQLHLLGCPLSTQPVRHFETNFVPSLF